MTSVCESPHSIVMDSRRAGPRGARGSVKRFLQARSRVALQRRNNKRFPLTGPLRSRIRRLLRRDDPTRKQERLQRRGTLHMEQSRRLRRRLQRTSGVFPDLRSDRMWRSSHAQERDLAPFLRQTARRTALSIRNERDSSACRRTHLSFSRGRGTGTRAARPSSIRSQSKQASRVSDGS